MANVGLIAVLLSHVWAGCVVAAKPAEFHVSPKGNDDNPGTVGKPFATLERARDAIRESGLAGKTTCTVWLHGGIYRRKQTFALEEQDSGTREHPVIFRGAKGETARLIGGTVLKPDAFTMVVDQALLERIPESARGRVYMLDLEAQGIKHTAPYPDKFTDNITFAVFVVDEAADVVLGMNTIPQTPAAGMLDRQHGVFHSGRPGDIGPLPAIQPVGPEKCRIFISVGPFAIDISSHIEVKEQAETKLQEIFL